MWRRAGVKWLPPWGSGMPTMSSRRRTPSRTPYGDAHLVIRTVRRPGTRRAPVSRTSRPAPPRSVRPRPESRARSTPSPGRWRRRAPGGTTPSRHSRTTLTGTTSQRTPSMRSRMCASWWGTSYTAWRNLPARMEMPIRRWTPPRVNLGKPWRASRCPTTLRWPPARSAR
ncbi:Uncharacterised protein [Mycobacteroides abscessus subsp. abscessus]|nr:Uncharacterised protein [Mycobacteroides abscessus subsp. abscessus]